MKNMKRIVCCLLPLCLTLCSASALAAQEKTSGDIRYVERSGGKAEIIGYQGKGKTVKIPEKVGGAP